MSMPGKKNWIAKLSGSASSLNSQSDKHTKHKHSFSRLASEDSGQTGYENEFKDENLDDGGRLALPLPARQASSTVASVAGLFPSRPPPAPGECERYPGMLHSLALAGDSAQVEKLLRMRPTIDGSEAIVVEVDAYNDMGETALMNAASGGYTQTCVLLLDYSADPRKTKSNSGRTALHYACEGGFADTANLMVKKGADINFQSRVKGDGKGMRGDERTPLHCAAAGGHLEVVEMLLKGIEVGRRTVRANIDAIDGSGKTPLHLCAASDKPACVRFLLESGANIEARDAAGETPLFSAVADRAVNATHELLRRRADVTAVTNNGQGCARLCAGVISTHKVKSLPANSHSHDDKRSISRGRGGEHPSSELNSTIRCLEALIEHGAAVFPTDRYFKYGVPDHLLKDNATNVEKHTNKKAGKGFCTDKEVEKQIRANFANGHGEVTDEELRVEREAQKTGGSSTST